MTSASAYSFINSTIHMSVQNHKFAKNFIQNIFLTEC